MSPYLLSAASIKLVGSVMLLIHLLTALCAYHLPESKGRDLGHTSLEDCVEDEEDTDGTEMFRYDNDGQSGFAPVNDEVNSTPPAGSSTGIV